MIFSYVAFAKKSMFVAILSIARKSIVCDIIF
jgi:hypothetical protein